MSNVKFFYLNQADNAVLSVSTVATMWPAGNMRHRWQSKKWRSRSGVGSGWGRFEITAANANLTFAESGALKYAVLTPGTYSAATLASHIETQMQAAGTQLYSVFFDETTFKFNIYCETAGQTVKLKLSHSNQVFYTIGFTGSTDRDYAQLQTADAIRIHTSESIGFTASSTFSFDGCFLIGTNLSSAAVVTVRTSTDGFVTWNDTVLARKGTMWAGVRSSAIPATSVLITIQDPANPAGFVAVGRLWIGGAFTPSIGVDNRSMGEFEDPSILTRGELRQVSGVELPQFKTFPGNIGHINETDLVAFKAMFTAIGKVRPLVFVNAKPDGSFSNPEERAIYGTFTRFDLAFRSGVMSLRFEVAEEG